MKTLHSLRAFSLFYTSSKFHCIISSHSCIFRWYNAIIPNLRQNSNISVRSAGDQSILGVLPAITQQRTSASGFWEIPGASWPAARMIRPIPAADAPSGSPTQFPVLTRTPLVFQSLHAVFVICVSRSHTYEVLISFAAKYRQPHPCLPAFMRAVYVSREF